MNFATFINTPIFLVIVLFGMTVLCYSFIETVFAIRLYNIRARHKVKYKETDSKDANKAAKEKIFMSIDFFRTQDRFKIIGFLYVVYFAVILYVLQIVDENIKVFIALHPTGGFFFVGFNVLLISICVTHLVAYTALKELFFEDPPNDS